MLTEEAFQQFKTIYETEHGTVDSDDELRKMATDLLILLGEIYKPIKKSWLIDDPIQL